MSVHLPLLARSSFTLRVTNTWLWTSVSLPCWRRTPWGWCWTLQGMKGPGSTSSLSINSAPLGTVWVIISLCLWTHCHTECRDWIKTGLNRCDKFTQHILGQYHKVKVANLRSRPWKHWVPNPQHEAFIWPHLEPCQYPVGVYLISELLLAPDWLSLQQREVGRGPRTKWSLV